MLLEQLLDNLAVEVEAFATCSVAPGWRLRVPALDSVTLHYVLEGRGEVRAGDAETRPLATRSLALIPPRLVHLIQCGRAPYAEAGVSPGGDPPGGIPVHRAGPEEEGELTVVCGRLQVLYGRKLGLFDQLREMLALDFSDDPRVPTLFDGLLEEVRSARPGSRAMATALMNESLIHVLGRLCTRADCSMPWLQALENPDLGPALGAMLEAPEQPHTVATLAEICYMSRSAFARHFTDAFGQPPMAYLRSIRLRHAARLLRRKPPLPVRTVATRVGFSSRSHFSRAFREYFATSPSEFGG